MKVVQGKFAPSVRQIDLKVIVLWAQIFKKKNCPCCLHMIGWTSSWNGNRGIEFRHETLCKVDILITIRFTMLALVYDWVFIYVF